MLEGEDADIEGVDMFVQIIEGTTTDQANLERQLDRWASDLRPDAEGFLGATLGVTADGHVVDIVRFDDEAHARGNSERPEQGRWWTETEGCFADDVAFTESSDVEMLADGGSDRAHFVQVMKSEGVDRDRIHAFDDAMAPYLEQRPDILGGMRVWTGPDRCVEVIYFTSEQEARRGEAQVPPELDEAFQEYADLMDGVQYLDLREPKLL
jgi:hypothetical protein